MIKYCNYHKHDEYSNLYTTDSTVHLVDYCKRAKELGHTILSTVEHGWVGNVFEAYQLAKEYELKLVVGGEFYFVKDRTTEDKINAHMVIIALNENGRQAINDISSEANLTGFYYKPRIDIELLLKLPEDDVIVTTACIGGIWKYEDNESILQTLQNKFKKHLYLEVQSHNNARQIALNKRILELHYKYGIELIAGIDSHYIYPEQAQLRDNLIESKGMHYEDEDGWYMDYPNGEELYQRFANQTVLSHEEIMQAINNTLIFENVEEYNCPVFNDDLKLPTLYPEWTQEQKDEEYKRLVWKGWDEYKKDIPKEQWETYITEINKEMQSVIDTHMADYFIIDYYIMQRGKEYGGKLTKSGRGSGSSFFTNTLLGFSDVDRISAPVHMYPERFLSTTRILKSRTCPDIDMNEAPTEPFVRAQADVLGQDHSYPMVAYGTMKTSAAWKLYAKSQGIPFEIANEVSNEIKEYELALKHADDDEKDDIKITDYIDKQYQEIFEKSKDYLGLKVSWSIAPCSSLIYMGSIRKEIGLVRIKDNICCALDGHVAESGHFLKNDHLKVSVVDLIYKAYERAGLNPPKVKKLIEMCPSDDECWKIFENGCTIGINQCEKDGTRTKVMKYKPTNISELSAFVAAIRPGGASYYKDFESRKPFSYGVKAFDNLIQTKEFPYSFLLYQEQIMAALNYAGIDMTECYTAIKNIAKKRVEKVLAYKDIFIKGFSEAIVKDENKSQEEALELADKLWKVVEDASNYLFNASHAYCVALDALYSAWIKAHYPLAFYETYMQLMEEKGDKDKMNLLKEEAEEYFKIKFPNFKFGQDNRKITMDITNNSITNSLSSIKDFGNDVGNVMYECGKQNFSSFVDVLKWLDERSIKSSKLLPLIEIDYFSQYGNSKKLSLIIETWDILKQGKGKSVKKDKELPYKLKDILERTTITTNSDGGLSSSYKIVDAINSMKEYEKVILSDNIDDYDIKTKMKYSQEILGYVSLTTNREEDRRKLLVTELTQINGKTGLWAYRIGTRSVGSGKTARITVKSDLYNDNKFNVGDVIYAEDIYKNKQGYWYLLKYHKE